MNLKTTWALVVAAILVTAGFERYESGRNPHFAYDEGRLFGVLRDETFRELSIERSGKATVALRRDQGDWRIVRPIEFRARGATVESLVRVLRYLRIRNAVGDGATGFGLEKRDLVVSFVDGQGSQHEVVFGDDYGEADRQYSYFSYAGKVYLCDSNVRDSFRDLNTQQLRDDALCPVSPRNANGLSIRTQDYSISLSKEQGEWRITQPIDVPADPVETLFVISLLNSWGIESFVDDAGLPTRAEELGFDPPRAEIEVLSEDGRRVSLLVGADIGGGPESGSVYVAWKGQPFVFSGSRDILAILSYRAADFRNKYLFDLPEPDIREVTFSSDIAMTVQVSGAGAPFDRMVVDGRDYPVDSKWFSTFTERMREAKLSEFLPRSGDRMAEYGLDSPIWTITVNSASAGSQILRVGREVEAGTGVHYLWRQGWDHFATGLMPVPELFTAGPYYLRSPSLLAVPFDAVRHVELVLPSGEKLEMVRTEYRWHNRRQQSTTAGESDELQKIADIISRVQATVWSAADSVGPRSDDYSLLVRLLPLEGGVDFEPVDLYFGRAAPSAPNTYWGRDGMAGWVFQGQFSGVLGLPFLVNEAKRLGG